MSASPLPDSKVDVPEVEDEGDSLPATRPVDPALLFLILLGVIILGLRSLTPDVRYTAVWTALIVIGVIAILLDHLEVEIPNAIDMLWGISFGAIIGVPLLLIATPQLQRTSAAMFGRVADAFVFQSLALVMPAGETLFFRGAMQPTRGWLFTALAASVWSVIVFFPQLQVTEFPLVAAVIGFFFVVVNFAYGYIKLRFGLFASWTCQMVVNLLLLFATRYL